MSIEEIFNENLITVDFKKFEIHSDIKQPSFENLEIKIYEQRSISILGTVALGLFYKGKITHIIGFNELNNGKTWEITQLQGAKKTGYRIQRCIKVVNMWAYVIEKLVSIAKNFELEQVIMPSPLDIENLGEAKSEGIVEKYKKLLYYLELKYSKKINKYIRQV